jgi:hypothetical protein
MVLLIDAHVGILVDAHVGILIEAYGRYIPCMISFFTWLMYMGVVHCGNILVHDVLG